MSIILMTILIPVIQVFAIWVLTWKDKRQMDRARRSYEARVAHLRVPPKFIVE